jgi:hypothetical protein
MRLAGLGLRSASARSSASTASEASRWGANAELLSTLVRAIVQIRSSEPSAARLRGVLGLIDDEALSGRPGRTLVLERLQEIMLVKAIRHRAVGEVRQGLLAGLGKQKIAAALRALHCRYQACVDGGATRRCRRHLALGVRRALQPDRPECLRSYLLHWRMAPAKDALRSGDCRLAEVAFACGYLSASAFNTAFSRVVGCSPARYATERRAQQPP